MEQPIKSPVRQAGLFPSSRSSRSSPFVSCQVGNSGVLYNQNGEITKMGTRSFPGRSFRNCIDGQME